MKFLLLFAASVLLIACLTPYLKSSRQETDLPSHFVLQYFIGACGLGLFSGLFTVPGLFYWLIFGSLLATVIQLVPLLRFGRNDLHPDTGKTLKILRGQRAETEHGCLEAESPDRERTTRPCCCSRGTRTFRPHVCGDKISVSSSDGRVAGKRQLWHGRFVAPVAVGV